MTFILYNTSCSVLHKTYFLSNTYCSVPYEKYQDFGCAAEIQR